MRRDDYNTFLELSILIFLKLRHPHVLYKHPNSLSKFSLLKLKISMNICTVIIMLNDILTHNSKSNISYLYNEAFVL